MTFQQRYRLWKQCKTWTRYRKEVTQVGRLNYYTTNAVSQESSLYAGYTVCNRDLTEQTRDDIMKVYTLPINDIKSILTDAVPPKFQKLSEIIREHSLLIRKPTFEALEHLERNKEAPARIILCGPDGAGKSLTLLQILHYCQKKNWVLLHVPNGDRFAESKAKIDDTQQSLWNELRADQPAESTRWLIRFRAMNMKFLSETETQNDYKWGKRESTEKGKPLLKVVEQGIGRSIYASDAVGVVLKEIQRNKNLQVLYAIDAFNGFYGNTTLRLNGKLVDTENLSLIHHFTKLFKRNHSLTHGCYVMSLSQTIHNARTIEEPTIEKLLPKYVLDYIGSYKEVCIPNYSDEEFRTILSFYQDKKWISGELSEDAISQIKFMTNRNPSQLHELCKSL